jgi:hypothetical protein
MHRSPVQAEAAGLGRRLDSVARVNAQLAKEGLPPIHLAPPPPDPPQMDGADLVFCAGADGFRVKDDEVRRVHVNSV